MMVEIALQMIGSGVDVLLGAERMSSYPQQSWAVIPVSPASGPTGGT